VNLVHEAVVVRREDAERLDGPEGTIELLVDAPATGGRFSTHRVRLAAGAAGASPHHHECSTEVFFVEGGVLDLLVGESVHRLHAGDFGAVPPGVVHAFGAAPGQTAEVVLLITPGIERFPFFRDLVEVQHGRLPVSVLAGERYDQVADDSDAWAAAR